MNKVAIKSYWNHKVLNELTGRSFYNALVTYVILFKLLGLKSGDKIVVLTKDIEQMSLLLLASYITGIEILVSSTEDTEKDITARIIAFFPKVIFCERRAYEQLEKDIDQFRSIPSLKAILTTGVVLSNNVKFDMHMTRNQIYELVINDINRIIFIDDRDEFLRNYSDVMLGDSLVKGTVHYLSDSSVEFQRQIKCWIDNSHKDFVDNTEIGSLHSSGVSLNIDLQKNPYILMKLLIKSIRILESPEADTIIFDSEQFMQFWKEEIETIKQHPFKNYYYSKYPRLYKRYVENTFVKRLGKFKELIIINPDFSKNILNLLGKSKLPVSTLTILRRQWEPSFYNQKGKDLASNNGVALRNISTGMYTIEKNITTIPDGFWNWIKKIFSCEYNKKISIKNHLKGYTVDSIGDYFATDIEEKFIASPLIKDATFATIKGENYIFIEPNYNEADLFALDLGDYSELEDDFQIVTNMINKTLPKSLKISKITIVDNDTLIKSKNGKTKKYLYRGLLASSSYYTSISTLKTNPLSVL